jgi:hypothetical protein
MTYQPPVDHEFVHARLDELARTVDSPLLLAPIRDDAQQAIGDARDALPDEPAAARHALTRLEHAVGHPGVPRHLRRRVHQGVRAIRAELDPTLVHCSCGRTRSVEQSPACR